MATLCVAIGIVGAILFISYCVTIGTLLVATIGGLPGFLFSCVSIENSLGATLGGLPGFCFVSTLGADVWCCGCIVGYRCVIGALTWYGLNATPRHCPLCLLVDCCSASFGIILNNSARLLIAV